MQGLFLFATIQIPDILIYNGNEYSLIENPMEIYFNQFPEKRPKWPHTALWRGYIATFEFIQNELWVIDIKKYEGSEIIDGNYTEKYTSMINECLDGKDRMKIDWFNGLLALLIESRHIEYGSTYEFSTIIEIENGNFQREVDMNYDQYIELRIKNRKEYESLVNKNNDGDMNEDEMGIIWNPLLEIYQRKY
jgi:hypothetical protein